MKLFKYIFFLILIVIIAGSVYVATLDGHFKVEKNLSFSAPSEVVFKQVKNLENWQDFSIWKSEEMDYKTSLIKNEAGEITAIKWESKKRFDGRLSNENSIPNNQLQQQLDFETGVGQSDAHLLWKFMSTEKGSHLKLSIEGELGFWAKAYQKTQDISIEQQFNTFFDQLIDGIQNGVKAEISRYDLHVDGSTELEGFSYIRYLSLTKYSCRP